MKSIRKAFIELDNIKWFYIDVAAPLFHFDQFGIFVLSSILNAFSNVYTICKEISHLIICSDPPFDFVIFSKTVNLLMENIKNEIWSVMNFIISWLTNEIIVLSVVMRD